MHNAIPYVAVAVATLIPHLCTASPLDTLPLAASGDLATRMVDGIRADLERRTAASVKQRAAYWNRDFSSDEAYIKSIEPNRERFRRIIGAADARMPVQMLRVTPVEEPPAIARGAGYTVERVRWPVFLDLNGEGLLLKPDSNPIAAMVVVPDCGWTPEMFVGLQYGVPAESQVPRRLAESGCLVLVPSLVDRTDTFSGHPDVRMTNQPHREFVYRAAYELGRHTIGFEVQKVLAAVDWFTAQGHERIAAYGYGEGGLIAFYSAAADTRIDAAIVSGYFGPRESLWSEPIYRNVWSLLHEFGDAEIASLIAPRTLIVDPSDHPRVDGPPTTEGRANTAAPGIIATPSRQSVEAELARANALVEKLHSHLVVRLATGNPSDLARDALLTDLFDALSLNPKISTHPPFEASTDTAFSEARRRRQYFEMVEHTQRLMRDAPTRRAEFWKKADATSLESWVASSKSFREYFHKEVIGALPEPGMPLNPRSRQFCETEKFTGYEVVLDVYPDVFAYGLLLLPKNIPAGERRPVVVCQHGLEGRPQDVADPNVDNAYYHQYGCRLAEQGFVVYAPQNPYIGEDRFRVLQRMANPLKLSIFSYIVRQHQRTLEWLKTQPFVDPDRIAFYGLSYGGKTAMRVPAILEDYCLSICSADYNEWIWKNASASSPYSYLFTPEYEMFEFDLGNTFNYAEMSWLIFPRPFMVERGHHDGVAPDEWVAYEYARTRRHYSLLGLADRTEIEYFNGPHEIHGVGTFAFLKKHLKFGQ